MTDQSTQPFETLLAQYEAGVANPGSEANAWLTARSEIEAGRDSLSAEQITRLDKADRALIQNADRVTLPESTGTHPRTQWWWYLDTLATAGMNAAEPVNPRNQMLSRIFTAVEVIVLVVAVALLLQNRFGLFTPAPPSTPVLPTATSAPTVPPPTLNPAAFDMSSAKPYTSDSKVLQLSLPADWQAQPPAPNDPNVYDFVYGPPQSPTAFVEVRVSDALEFYNGVSATDHPDSPVTALAAIKKRNATAKFGEVHAAKIGSLDAQAVTVDVPASAQGGPASQVELRLAQVSAAKVVYIVSQSSKELADKAFPVIGKIIDTVVINLAAIPTTTPTPTLHPLQMTGTALEQTIVALTPTSTPTTTPTPSVTPGGPTNTPAVIGTPGANSTTTASGLQIEDTVVGTGTTATAGKTVRVRYTGKLTDGTVFDKTEGKTPDYFEFALGGGNVIKGWDEGVVGMKVGGKRRLTIPPAIGYGANGSGPIPANATLIFDIELVNVQ